MAQKGEVFELLSALIDGFSSEFFVDFLLQSAKR